MSEVDYVIAPMKESPGNYEIEEAGFTPVEVSLNTVCCACYAHGQDGWQ